MSTEAPIECRLCGAPKPAHIDHIWACCGDGPGYGDQIKPEKLACVERQLYSAQAKVAELRQRLDEVACALHGWEPDARKTYVPDELPGMAQRYRAKLSGPDSWPAIAGIVTHDEAEQRAKGER